MSAELAYEINGRRVPAAEFYALACDPRRSVAVEACAGAGKTWMLVSRIVRALLDGAQPHEILAITFTKKAAGEMRGRLQEWLAEFAQASDEKLAEQLVMRGVPAQAAAPLVEPLRALYGRLLAHGRPVQIRTFHSWFAALLRTAPLALLEQLGLPARHELLEDDAQAIAQVWRRFHERVLQDGQARQDYTESIAAHGRSQTQKALHAALSKRIEFALADARGVVDASVRPWQEVFPDLAGAASPHAAMFMPGAARELLAQAAVHLGRASQPSFSKLGAQLEQALGEEHWDAAVGALLTQSGSPRKFSDKLEGVDTLRQAQGLVQRLCEARHQHASWQHQQRMARLSRLLIEEYAALKRESGWVDMNDVERAAQILLSDPVLSGWMQERLDARVRHLLIDEFQDTNPLQWQALHGWLSGYAGAGGGQAPGVFIVGDPKQSIYRFRRAEPQVFRAAQRFLREALGGALLGCDHTRRNAPQVLQAMNEVMQAAQASGQYEGFRPHTTASDQTGQVWHLPQVPREQAGEGAPDEARAGEGAGKEAGAAAWRDSLTQPRETPEEHLIALECRQAARWIDGLIRQGRQPQDIMVLARKRDRLVAMQEELRPLGIPAQQAEKSELGDAPEVQDLVALLDVLVSPTHDLSLARVLKSPVFGVEDAALVSLAGRARVQAAQGEPASWFELLQSGDEAWPASLQGVGVRLARWQQWVLQMPPHDALDAIYQDGDVLARYAPAAPPAWRERTLANLRALLGAALSVGGGRYTTPYAFVRAMRAGGVPAPAVAQAAAVSLLTVHGAKGLEAPVVLLLDTDAAAARAETMGVLVDWPGEDEAPRRFAFIASEGQPPACCVDALAREQAERQREELNALYVAMTRAVEVLAVSSVQPRTAAPGSWWARVKPAASAVESLPAPAPAPAATALGQAALPFEDNGPTCELPQVPHLDAGQRRAPAGLGPLAPQTLASRFGQAVHRLIECSPDGRLPADAGLLHRIGREFGLTASSLHDAHAMARRILEGEGAWAWDARCIEWAGNEVELSHQGQALRLDRLVQRRDDGSWWVLDVKSASQPQLDDSLLAQLRQYMAAVQALHPGEPVAGAFLTGEGRLRRVGD